MQERSGWNGLTTTSACELPAIEPGRYDVKLADNIGRVCIVRNVDVKEGAVFSIEEKHLTDGRKVEAAANC
jgi:hypothetical protein